MKYKASLDSLTKILSVSVVFFLVGMFVYLWQFRENNGVLIPLLILIPIFIVVYLYSPQYYLLDDSNLKIVRIASNVTVKLSDITKITGVEKRELGFGIRTFGSGGFLGYYGKFTYDKIGKVTLYATQRKNMVLIDTKDGKKIIITPDDMGLLELVKEKINKLPK